MNSDNDGRLKGLEVGMVLIQSLSRWFDTRACSAIRATCSAGGYSSGQRGQTVNLLAYAYGGSSPSPPITLQSTVAFGERALSLHGGERPGCAGPRAAAPRRACTALAQRASSPFGGRTAWRTARRRRASWGRGFMLAGVWSSSSARGCRAARTIPSRYWGDPAESVRRGWWRPAPLPAVRRTSEYAA